MKVWIVYTMLFATPAPLPDSPEFKTEMGCRLFLAGWSQQVVVSFKLVCAEK